MSKVLSPERWAKVEGIFERALSVESTQRHAFLVEVCAGDEELRREVESLLEADDNVADDFLQSSPVALGLKIMADEETRSDEMISETTQVFEAEISVGMVIAKRFKILEKLDAGGMGEVYKAEDMQVSGRPVVVKVLKKASQQNPWIVEHFEREGEAQGLIGHSNIATIIAKGSLENGQPYLVVEFAKGKTLRKEITEDKPRMAVSKAKAIMEQICDAVTVIHNAHLIHRDLKPENIMVHYNAVTGKFEVKVIDFGIVRMLNKSTRLDVKPGTPAFMSPEQKEGGQEVTFASDVYALGLIANVMLMGRHPFYPNYLGVESKPSVLRSVLRFPARRVIRKAIADDASQRQQSARAFFEELVRALNFWRRVTAAAAAVMLIALIFGGVVAWRFSFESGSTPVEAQHGLKIAPERNLNYSLLVRKNPKRYPNKPPVTSLGDRIFEVGDLVRLNMSSPQAGYLYVINERPPQANRPVQLNVLFPIAVINHGSAAVAANQPFQIPPRSSQPESDWLELDAEKGVEKIWLVWSEQAVPELEAVKVWANPKDEGEIRDRNQVEAVKQYLTAHATTAPKAEMDEARKRMKLTSNRSALIGLVQIEHH